MVDTSRETSAFRLTVSRAALAGAALGAVPMAAAGLVLHPGDGIAIAATGLTATLLLSLLVGIWAGAPVGDAPPPYSERWVAAGVAVAVAGAFSTFLLLYGAAAAAPVTRMLTLAVLLAAPVYTLGMLLPVLLVWGEGYEVEEAEERWGALGGVVVGTLGGMALGAAATGLILLTWFGVGPLLLAVSVLLLAPVFVPDPELPGANERVLAEVHSPISHLRVTEVVFPGERQPERRLYLGEEQESGELVRSGAPTLAYIVAAESWLTRSTPSGSTYLFLGGGAYTLPRRVAEHDTRAQITVAELDPEATRLAYRFFGVRRDHGIRSVHGDARAFLERTTERWDRIYLDVYGGTETLPFPLTTVEAFQAARERLRPAGVLGVNLIGVVDGPEARRPWSVVRTLGEVFPQLAVFSHFGPDYPDRQNLLLLAAGAEARLPITVSLFQPWALEEWPAVDASVLHDLQPGLSGERETRKSVS
jgi:hypothetical protein